MTGDVLLREVTEADLPIFFEQQLDPAANYMAAFTARDPADREAFLVHWGRILGDASIIKQTILFDGQVAGSISCYQDELGRPEVTYWIGKPYWGQGIATRALAALLAHVPQRPLYARVAKDHLASLRVLEKGGFAICGEDRGYANARSKEVEEYLLRLDPGEGEPLPHDEG
jgi:RimJ/RimL family protein N-acetyltransferase